MHEGTDGVFSGQTRPFVSACAGSGVGGGGERTLHFGSETAAAGAEKEESERGRQKHREVGEAERKWRKRK